MLSASLSFSTVHLYARARTEEQNKFCCFILRSCSIHCTHTHTHFYIPHHVVHFDDSLIDFKSTTFGNRLKYEQTLNKRLNIGSKHRITKLSDYQPKFIYIHIIYSLQYVTVFSISFHTFCRRISYVFAINYYSLVAACYSTVRSIIRLMINSN